MARNHGMTDRTWKVGELANRTGLTVRTLHHWDRIGLLVPGARTGAGHRLYGLDDLHRLQKILSLRSVGLGLGQIARRLDDPESSLAKVLRQHLDRIRDESKKLQLLERRLTWLLQSLEAGTAITDDDLLETMEMMRMFENHYTPEQLEKLKAQQEALGPESIRRAQEEWPKLIASVREAMDNGLEPTSDQVLALAKRWKGLIDAFTGGDKGIEASLGKMYQSEPQMAESQGMDPGLFQYIGAAMKAVEEER